MLRRGGQPKVVSRQFRESADTRGGVLLLHALHYRLSSTGDMEMVGCYHKNLADMIKPCAPSIEASLWACRQATWHARNRQHHVNKLPTRQIAPGHTCSTMQYHSVRMISPDVVSAGGYASTRSLCVTQYALESHLHGDQRQGVLMHLSKHQATRPVAQVNAVTGQWQTRDESTSPPKLRCAPVDQSTASALPGDILPRNEGATTEGTCLRRMGSVSGAGSSDDARAISRYSTIGHQREASQRASSILASDGV